MNDHKAQDTLHITSRYEPKDAFKAWRELRGWEKPSRQKINVGEIRDNHGNYFRKGALVVQVDGEWRKYELSPKQRQQFVSETLWKSANRDELKVGCDLSLPLLKGVKESPLEELGDELSKMKAPFTPVSVKRGADLPACKGMKSK